MEKSQQWAICIFGGIGEIQNRIGERQNQAIVPLQVKPNPIKVMDVDFLNLLSLRAMKADLRNLFFDCHPMFYKVQGSTNIKICAQFVELENIYIRIWFSPSFLVPANEHKEHFCHMVTQLLKREMNRGLKNTSRLYL